MIRKKIKKSWNKVFEKKDWGENTAEDQVRLIKKLKKKIYKKRIKILEIGCGAGGNLWLFGKEKIYFDAIDISNIAIKKVNKIFQSKYKNYKKYKKKIICCDVLNMPNTLKNYDVIIDSETLCYSSIKEFKEIESEI